MTIFCFLILACGGGGGGEDAASIPPPAAPQNVVSSNANSQAILSWGKVNGATEYRIYWSTKAGVSKETGTMIPSVSSPYTHTGLTNGVTYYYVVTAVNQYGESAESNEVSATPSLATPPLPPASVATHAGNKAVNIAWSESQSEEAVTSYNIYWSVSSGVTKENGIKITDVSSPYVHTNLINDTTTIILLPGSINMAKAMPLRRCLPRPTGGMFRWPRQASQRSGQAMMKPRSVGMLSVGRQPIIFTGRPPLIISSQNGTKIEDVKSPYLHSGLERGDNLLLCRDGGQRIWRE